MWALVVVMSQKGLGDFTNLLKRFGMEDLETFLVIGSIEAFDKRIFIRSMGRTDVGLDAETEQKPDERGRKITSSSSPDETRIAIKSHPRRNPRALQKVNDGFQNSLRMEIGTDLSIKEDGGTSIDEIENFNHVLLLACWISWNARNAFARPFELLQVVGDAR